jgi:hypothetical protein
MMPTDDEMLCITHAESMPTTQRLACAVLMFHGNGRWSDHERNIWQALTGESEATNRTLCDLARLVLSEKYGEGNGMV